MGEDRGLTMKRMLRVSQVKSTIGRPQSHRETLRCLGLRRLNRSVILKDTPAIRGMIFKVKHLVDVEEIEGTPEGTS